MCREKSLDAMIPFRARSQSCEDQVLASPRLPDRACVLTKQLGFQRTDFHEIWYESFRKSVGKVQVSWNSDKNNLYYK